MREPEHAATVVNAMVKSVRIPVTVKMRAGWNDTSRNAPELARMVQDAGAAAVTIHGRTAAQSYTGSADWNLVARVADQLTIPVLGSGDCVEPEQIVESLQDGGDPPMIVAGCWPATVDDHRWSPLRAVGPSAACSSGAASSATPGSWRRRPTSRPGVPYCTVTLGRARAVSDRLHRVARQRAGERGCRLQRHGSGPQGLGLRASGRQPAGTGSLQSRHDRWVINKLRALCAWYSKGIDCGSHLRIRVNSAPRASRNSATSSGSSSSPRPIATPMSVCLIPEAALNPGPDPQLLPDSAERRGQPLQHWPVGFSKNSS